MKLVQLPNIRSLAAACGVVFSPLILLVSPVRADRVLVMPAGSAQSVGEANAEVYRGLGKMPGTYAWLNVGLPTFELEAARFSRPERVRTVFSVQTQIFPETFATPAISAGIRDVGNSGRGSGNAGYDGRSFYLSSSKELIGTDYVPAPFRRIVVGAGIATGHSSGLFGSVSSDIGFGFRQTVEFDGKRLNLRLAHDVFSVGRIEYARLGGSDYVGIQLHSPLRF